MDGKSERFYWAGRYGLDATGMALKQNLKEALPQEGVIGDGGGGAREGDGDMSGAMVTRMRGKKIQSWEGKCE